jgi:phage terminase small subunit
MGFSNMADYTRVVGTELIVDLSKASRDELAAVQEITVEDYMDGRGEDAREVRRTKFKLHGKEGPLEKIAKIMGYVIDRREQGSPGDFTALSDEELKQRLADELLAGGIPEEVARAFIRARSSE